MFRTISVRPLYAVFDMALLLEMALLLQLARLLDAARLAEANVEDRARRRLVWLGVIPQSS